MPRTAPSRMDGQEMATAVRRAWRLLGALRTLVARGNDPLRAERYAEIARDVLADALGEPRGFRGMRTEENKPAPCDEIDDAAKRLMIEEESKPTTSGSTKKLESAARKVWLLLGGADHWNTIVALLPAGGSTCRRWVEIARDVLAEALGEPSELPPKVWAREADMIAHDVMAGR